MVIGLGKDLQMTESAGAIADLVPRMFLLSGSPLSPAPAIAVDLQRVRERFIHETEIFLEMQLSSDVCACRWPQRGFSPLCRRQARSKIALSPAVS